ncbi:MAG: hypothetical protein JF591_07210, partial [Lysobacter sp.]|nr:hypothetical protein [Lysobacter sp.]
MARSSAVRRSLRFAAPLLFAFAAFDAAAAAGTPPPTPPTPPAAAVNTAADID